MWYAIERGPANRIWLDAQHICIPRPEYSSEYQIVSIKVGQSQLNSRQMNKLDHDLLKVIENGNLWIKILCTTQPQQAIQFPSLLDRRAMALHQVRL